jgi:hypothetical protein
MNVFMGGEFVSIHMRIPRFYETLGARRAWMYLTINPDTRIVIITLNGVDEFMMHRRRAPGEEIDEAGIRASIQRAIGTDIPVTIISQRGWHAGGYLVAARFQHRRLRPQYRHRGRGKPGLEACRRAARLGRRAAARNV